MELAATAEQNIALAVGLNQVTVNERYMLSICQNT